MKILRFSSLRVPRNSFISAPSSWDCICISRDTSGMQFSISVDSSTSSALRLAALFQSSLPMERKRQIFARYA